MHTHHVYYCIRYMYTRLECVYTHICGEHFIAMGHDRAARNGTLGFGNPPKVTWFQMVKYCNLLR